MKGALVGWQSRSWPTWLLALVLLALAPLVLGPYARYVISMWLVFAIAAAGLNIPVGLGGIFSFGHGAFMLIGAYALGVGATQWGLPLPAAALAAVLIAALAGVLVGLPSLRLAGFSLAIVTFAFAHMLFHLCKAFEYTGGPQGIFMPDSAAAGWWNGTFHYYLVLVVFFAALGIAHSLMTSKTGRALRALGPGEVVAQSLGVHPFRYKVLAFVLSAMYGAVSGSLLAIVTGYVAPDTYAPELSVSVFAAVMIGGVGTLVGPVLGALFVVLIPELTQSVKGLSLIIYAVLFTAVATFYPTGLVGAWHALRERALRRGPA